MRRQTGDLIDGLQCSASLYVQGEADGHSTDQRKTQLELWQEAAHAREEARLEGIRQKCKKNIGQSDNPKLLSNLLRFHFLRDNPYCEVFEEYLRQSTFPSELIIPEVDGLSMRECWRSEILLQKVEQAKHDAGRDFQAVPEQERIWKTEMFSVKELERMFPAPRADGLSIYHSALAAQAAQVHLTVANLQAVRDYEHVKEFPVIWSATARAIKRDAR